MNLFYVKLQWIDLQSHWKKVTSLQCFWLQNGHFSNDECIIQYSYTASSALNLKSIKMRENMCYVQYIH